MLEHTHTFALVDGTEVTFHFRNTLFEDIRERELAAIADVDNAPDGGIRSNFCYILARVTKIDNAPAPDWLWSESVKDASSFSIQYRRFARNINDETMIDLVRQINLMKTPNRNPVTKPDDTLTDEERADPKSTPPAERSTKKK